jgi:thiamine biosynthesis lipoprotein
MITSVTRSDASVRFRAMATDVNVQVVHPRASAASALARAEDLFHRVERACTRFDAESPLMLANAFPREWHVVPDVLFAAVSEAARAHRETDGSFDPRVLRTLTAYGYDRSLPFAAGGVDVEAGDERPAAAHGSWRPGLDDARASIRIGRDPIDLGGIGKGLAVRWAAAELGDAGRGFLIEAGGDCYASGASPDADGWRIGVEDPTGGPVPLAVLDATDTGVATSSIRLRKWRAGGKSVHHLIDPRTGEAAETGLLAVTVLGPDPAWAEVWSKSLFLAGRGAMRHLADDQGLAALWVDEDGFVGTSRAMKPRVLWTRD